MPEVLSAQHSAQIHRLNQLCDAVPGPDESARTAAQMRLNALTKPRDSLGQIEALLARLAACTGQVCPALDQRVVFLAAADHGVAAEGVSAYPQSVTTQMVLNFLSGGAAVNALAGAAGARIRLIDAGVAGELPEHPALRRLNIRRGSGNIAREPALTHAEALAALLAGADLVQEELRSGLNLLALAEMGIANTTPAAALTSAFTGAPPTSTVGRGTGVDDTTLERKRAVVAAALRRCYAKNLPATTPNPQDAFELLCELGGLEIAVLAGATLAAAAHRVPVLIDGYITTSAVLVAAALAPNLRTHLFAAHRSHEPGHALAMAHLGLMSEAGAGPLLQLDLRLGEGSGAALAMPLLVSATHLMREMATFEQAGVSDAVKGDE